MTEQQPGSSSSGVPDSEPVLGGDGPLSGPAVPGSASETPGSDSGAPESASNAPGPVRASLADLVDQPAKVMRIGTMLKQLLEEVRSAPLDDAGRTRLAEIHERSVKELEDGLAPELVQELHRINLPFEEDSVPTDAELRVAQAQLVGWLEGLFHGIQTALAAQQMANQQLAAKLQLRQLPPGTVIAPGVVVGADGEPVRAPGKQAPADPEHRGPGQYL
ncbi:bacterial proteasome activator family protein [uncultured Arthrobacter sp.]|uniref:bacterial proteasome activator family protein n=1 Tax=uncultured Arthrobacter sp. TaxID=114050 RepID=UPI0025D3E221|nr:bacterial proteasome activator family protein [uncultured Arthrobacter sp.]